MNTADLVISGSRVEVNSLVTIEWKPDPAASVLVDKVIVDGLDALRVSSLQMKGWIRIHLSIPPSDLNVLAARCILMIRSAGAIKPFCVETSIHNGSCKEIRSAPGTYTSLKADQWYGVSGVFVRGKVRPGYRVDVLIDLPRGTEILLADAAVAHFAAEIDPNKAAALQEAIVEPLFNFRTQEIHDPAGWLAAPAVFGGSIEIDGNALTGTVIASAPALYLRESRSQTGGTVALSLARDFDGVRIADCGFHHQLEPQGPEPLRLELRVAETAPIPFWTGSTHQAGTLGNAKRASFPRDLQENIVLLWAPISTAGLTVQLEQVVAILNKHKFPFRISYHIDPQIEHPLAEYWVDPRDIDRPKMVIYFERFVEFDRGFDGAFKIFYLNLDWLSGRTLALARVHARVVLCPTPYMLGELTETLQNSKVIHLPWPSKFTPRSAPPTTDDSQPIRILYVGNDYDTQSRKHPFEVVEAIERVTRADLRFTLKFRSPLPHDVVTRLMRNPLVEQVIDWSTDHEFVETLYATADINLIPNACEGNGLSILEAWAMGVVPAVLDGHPMNDVTSPDNSYRIACEENGRQEYAPYYRTTADNVLAFLDGLDREDVRQKKANVAAMAPDLAAREAELEKVLVSCIMMSGLRTKGLRTRVEEAHVPSGKYVNMGPRFGDRIKDLMFSDEGQALYARRPRQIDVILTTSQRPWCLRESLGQLLKAVRSSPFNHRVLLAIDTLDTSTLNIVNAHSAEIDQILWTKDRHGLPYMWNSANDLLRNVRNRTELTPDYICYIQDDCYINDPATYFEKMVRIAHAAMPGYLGFVSGYYTEVHPGFADFEWRGNRVVASDSIDGKNFMATPELLASIGPLTWWFPDGMRRGNPGPLRGSHFDLWQWKEAPNALTAQSRVSLVLPDLCSHIAARASDSTWNNDTTDESVKKRVDAANIYQTRAIRRSSAKADAKK